MFKYFLTVNILEKNSCLSHLLEVELRDENRQNFIEIL